MLKENTDGLQLKVKNLKAKLDKLEKQEPQNEVVTARTKKYIAQAEALLGSTSRSVKTAKK